jgi:hypothetical protein
MGVATANEYVPPPTGPYQSSSIVINSVEENTSEQPQVYRFPPSDLITDEMEQSESGPEVVHAEPAGIAPPSVQGRVNSEDYPQQPASMPPVYSQPYNNWARQGMAQPPMDYRYQGGYQNGTWGYPQQYYSYPYSNPEQYDPTNSQYYNNMPSPWSMMPKNPFSSGRK